MTAPRVTFVIVSYRCAPKVAAAVRSIWHYCDVSFEVVVVDNSESSAEVAALRSALPHEVRIVAAPRNGGFGYGCNMGARESTAEHLFFLNPDAELTSRCVARLVGHLEQDPRLGAVGGRLVYPDGAEGHSFGSFISLRRPLQMFKGSVYAFRDRAIKRRSTKSPKHTVGRELMKVDWCSGADLLMRKRDFDALGGFDESYFMYYEECDLQYRMHSALGLAAMVDGGVDVLHEDGGTGLESERKRRLIEQGCLHFVRDHRPGWHARLYHALTLGALATDATLQVATLQFARFSPCFRLMSYVATL